MEVIVMPKTSHDTMDLRIVKVDDLHNAGLEKQIDQLGCGLTVILRVGPTDRKLPPIFANCTDVHVQATLMAFVRIEFCASG